MSERNITFELFDENKELKKLLDKALVMQRYAEDELEKRLNRAVLFSKKAKVMQLIDKVPELGVHQQGWKYAKAEDVKEAVRPAMAEAGLSLSFELVDYVLEREAKKVLLTGRVAFTLECGETGATETKIVPGEVLDFGVADKAFLKLYTTTEKIFLKTTFLISTGEDLDSDADNHQAAAKAEYQQDRKGKPQQKPAQQSEVKTMTAGLLMNKLKAEPEVGDFYSKADEILPAIGRDSWPATNDIDEWRKVFAAAKKHAVEKRQEEVVIESQNNNSQQKIEIMTPDLLMGKLQSDEEVGGFYLNADTVDEILSTIGRDSWPVASNIDDWRKVFTAAKEYAMEMKQVLLSQDKDLEHVS